MFTKGFAKTASLSEKDRKDVRNVGLGAAGVGAVRHIGQDMYHDYKEKKVRNSKSLKDFSKSLKKGDILLMGSTPKNSGAITLGDMPDKVQKFGKFFGGTKKTRLLTNSTLLNQIGGGKKYHAGIYVGRGRIAHMSTSHGAVSERITESPDFHSTVKGQNIAAYRFKDSKHAERASAVRFAKKSIKDKVQYQKSPSIVAQAAGNLVSPVGKKACRKNKNGMVCNTLPIRAYDKRKFGKGEWTYSGDIRRAKNLVPVARRDVVKLPAHLKGLSMAGQATKGVKWGLGAAGAAYGYKKYKDYKSKK